MSSKIKIDDCMKKACEHYTGIGCIDKTDALGIQKMPFGYHLFLNADHTHFFWVRYDGEEGLEFHSKWDAYKSAVKNKSEDNKKFHLIVNGSHGKSYFTRYPTSYHKCCIIKSKQSDTTINKIELEEYKGN